MFSLGNITDENKIRTSTVEQSVRGKSSFRRASMTCPGRTHNSNPDSTGVLSTDSSIRLQLEWEWEQTARLIQIGSKVSLQMVANRMNNNIHQFSGWVFLVIIVIVIDCFAHLWDESSCIISWHKPELVAATWLPVPVDVLFFKTPWINVDNSVGLSDRRKTVQAFSMSCSCTKKTSYSNVDICRIDSPARDRESAK